MLTPEQIENQEFRKVLRGYKEEDVDEFLDQIKEDMELLYRENKELKEKMDIYKKQIEGYKNIEETLKATLLRAEMVAEDTCSAANKKAKLIVEDAQLQAKQQLERASLEITEIKKEHEFLNKEFRVFRNKFKTLLENEMNYIDEVFYETKENGKEEKTVESFTKPKNIEKIKEKAKKNEASTNEAAITKE